MILLGQISVAALARRVERDRRGHRDVQTLDEANHRDAVDAFGACANFLGDAAVLIAEDNGSFGDAREIFWSHGAFHRGDKNLVALRLEHIAAGIARVVLDEGEPALRPATHAMRDGEGEATFDNVHVVASECVGGAQDRRAVVRVGEAVEDRDERACAARKDLAEACEASFGHEGAQRIDHIARRVWKLGGCRDELDLVLIALHGAFVACFQTICSIVLKPFDGGPSIAVWSDWTPLHAAPQEPMTSLIRTGTLKTLRNFAMSFVAAGALLTSHGQAQQVPDGAAVTSSTSTPLHGGRAKQRRRRGPAVVVNPPGPGRVVIRPGVPAGPGVVVVAPQPQPPVVVAPRPPVYVAPPPVVVAPPPVVVAPPPSVGLLLNSGRANFGSITLYGSQLAQPYSMQVVSGGNIDASRVGLPSNCRGFVTQNPDVIVQYQQPGRQLGFFAEAQGDTTLVVRGPNGQWWCSDDEGGNRNPLIAMVNAQPGQYEVWVGSYNAGQQIQSRFVVYDPSMQQQPQAYQPPPPVYQPPPQPVYPQPQPVYTPDCRRTMIELGLPSTQMMFCDGAEPYCADALLRRGHAATNLMFCRGVNPQCAVSMMQSGRQPTELMNCR